MFFLVMSKNRNLRPWVYLVAAAIALSLAFGAAAQQGFQIIAHPDISVDFISKSDASDYFLKKESEWRDGTGVFPVDLTVREVQNAFSDQVHDRSRSSIKKYWQRQIFTGRGTPPPERESDREVIDFVRQTPGAIGYVSASARIQDGEVKVLALR